MSRLVKLGFIPDSHHPYQSKHACAVALASLHWFKPDLTILLGDQLDCYACSDHDKDPARRLSLKWEIGETNKWLDAVNGLPGKKHFIEGNHEYRLPRHIAKHSPALYGMLDIKKELRIEDRGWGFTPYKRSYRVGKLLVSHDWGSAGAEAHMKARVKMESNAVIGHTHRMAVGYLGNVRGVSKVGGMFGWLGDPESVDYRHHDLAVSEWQHGFGIGYMEPNGVVRLQPIPIVGGTACINGTIVGRNGVLKAA